MKQNRLKKMRRNAAKEKSNSRRQTRQRKETPLFNTQGRIITPSVVARKKKIRTIACVVFCILAFIYLPGFFIRDKQPQESSVVADTSAIRLSNSVLRSSLEEDFDGDGLTNGMEVEHGTNAWDIDTDKDGLWDSYEVKTGSSDPVRPDYNIIVDFQTKQDKQNGKTVSSPYKVEGVTLWAEDYTSKANGDVAETRQGYNICYFNGYAQFPSEKGKYAYKVENGIHTLLPYREYEDVWKVQAGQTVEIYPKALEEAVRIGFFNKYGYLETSWLSTCIDFILPDKGFLTARKIMKIDADPNVHNSVTLEIVRPDYDSSDTSRFSINTNRLDSYKYVLDMLEQEKCCIAVSLYNNDRGEYRGIIYGHDGNGSLYIADMDTLQYVGTLRITEQARKMLNENGDMISWTYFDFQGLGFSSLQGDRISFFAAAEKANTDIQWMQEDESMPSDLSNADIPQDILTSDTAQKEQDIDAEQESVSETEPQITATPQPKVS